MLWSRDGAVVRALASYQLGPGSISGPGVICGLNLMLFLRVLRFSSLHKNQHFQIRSGISGRRATLWRCHCKIPIYLFYLFYLRSKENEELKQRLQQCEQQLQELRTSSKSRKDEERYVYFYYNLAFYLTSIMFGYFTYGEG